MGIHMKWAAAGMTTLALFTASPASACLMATLAMPPSRNAGETPDAFRQRSERIAELITSSEFNRQLGYQAGLWAAADTVILGRIETISNGRRVIRPIGWLKSARSRTPFSLTFTGITSCGGLNGADVNDGEIGDTFVLFLKAGAPGNRTLIDSIAPDHIVDFDIKRALDAAGK